MNELIVSKADFDLYRPLPASLQDQDFTPYILRAQRGFIKDVLGAALYRDIHANKSEARNVTLISGGTTTDESGDTIDFYGLAPAIVNYAYALYLRDADLATTRAGNRRNRRENSDSASNELIASRYKKSLDEGAKYLESVVKYLYDNRSTYTLFKGLKNRLVGSIRAGVATQYDFYTEDDNFRYVRGYLNDLNRNFYGY